MGNRRKKDGNSTQKNHPTKKGIEGSEQFGPFRLHFIYRTHAGKDHEGVVKAINIIQVPKIMVTKNSDTHGDQQKHQS